MGFQARREETRGVAVGPPRESDPGAGAGENFNCLLDACEELASSQSLARLAAGVNTARHEAYSQMLARGFRAELLGVAMQKPNDAAYNRPGVYLIDDWR
jgi:hypothetical protein